MNQKMLTLLGHEDSQNSSHLAACDSLKFPFCWHIIRQGQSGHNQIKEKLILSNTQWLARLDNKAQRSRLPEMKLQWGVLRKGMLLDQ